MRVVEPPDDREELFDALHEIVQMSLDIYVCANRRAGLFDAESREKQVGDVLVFEKLEGEVVDKASIDI